MRTLLGLMAVVVCLAAPAYAQSAQSLAAPADPATTSEPVVHHHKAYAISKYGISCPGDTVVWVNTTSGVYHLEGERWFGRTKAGQFECEKNALAEGDRETRNGQ